MLKKRGYEGEIHKVCISSVRKWDLIQKIRFFHFQTIIDYTFLRAILFRLNLTNGEQNFCQSFYSGKKFLRLIFILRSL